MIPAAFDYVAPETLSEAVALVAESDGDAKILAGGHSLLPLMKLRLSTPGLLIDLNRIGDLRFIRKTPDGFVEIGAMTRYVEIESSDLIRSGLPLLAQATPLIGDAQVRNRGTIGGAVAHADPAGDMPAILCALAGVVRATGPRGGREWEANDFFRDIFETALAEDEIVTSIRFPVRDEVCQYYEKFRRRAADWAIVGAAVNVRVESDVVVDASAVLVNVATTPVRARKTEAALVGKEPTAENIRAAADLASDGLDPTGELNASAEYKIHLSRVITRRAMENAFNLNNPR
jgi:carbon-monoxide dehydrogenase medium subunit